MSRLCGVPMLLPLSLAVVGAAGTARTAFDRVRAQAIGTSLSSLSSTPDTLQMPLDHFDKMCKKEWGMRYWADDRFYTPGPAGGAVVFLSMGGEGAQGAPGGQQVELAKVHGALLFSIEHRFCESDWPAPLPHRAVSFLLAKRPRVPTFQPANLPASATNPCGW